MPTSELIEKLLARFYDILTAAADKFVADGTLDHDQAFQLALVIFQEIQKGERMSGIREREEQGEQEEEPATEKQLALLKKLRVEYVPPLSKNQASELITKALEAKKK